MKKNIYVDCSPTRFCFEILMMYGANKVELENALGMAYEELKKTNRRILLEKHYAMMVKGIEMTRSDIPLIIGGMFQPEHLGVVGHVIRNCENLTNCGLQLVRYFKLFSEDARWDLEEYQNDYKFKYKIELPEYRKNFRIEMTMSSAISIIRSLTNTDFIPKAVFFQYDQPENIDDYKKFFKAPLKFNMDVNAIIFTQEHLMLSIPDHQPYLKNVLLDVADSMMTDLKIVKTFQSDIKQLILRYLPNATVDIEMISQKVNMSRWTLTRKLTKEGTTFQKLLTEVRETLAISYLKNQKLSINEITFLLGYSETSTFHRAFKKWTGKTPDEYRKSNMMLS